MVQLRVRREQGEIVHFRYLGPLLPAYSPHHRADLIKYRLVYPDPRESEQNPSGGYVEVHITHHTERDIQTAILLAKQEFRVRLMGIDVTPGKKNPDAYFLNEAVDVEFKHNFTPTRSAIEEAIRKGRLQATHLVLHIFSEVSRAGIRSKFFFHKKLLYLWIIWKDEVLGFARTEIFDGTIERKIK